MNAEQLLRKMVKENRSRVEMAAALSISTDTLRTRLEDLGLVLPKRTHSLAAIKAAFAKAGTCAGAARLLTPRLTRQAVHSRLVEAGVIVPKPVPA